MPPAKIELMNQPAQKVLDELAEEFRKEGREMIVIYSTPDGAAHYRTVGFVDVPRRFRLLGMLDWTKKRLLKGIDNE